jgi:hypothetical protein
MVSCVVIMSEYVELNSILLLNFPATVYNTTCVSSNLDVRQCSKRIIFYETSYSMEHSTIIRQMKVCPVTSQFGL